MDRIHQPDQQPSPAAEPLTREDLAATVICPTCHVAADARCITRAGKPARETHGRRFEAVEDAAGITAHRATARREAEARGGWLVTFDRKAEDALLAAYAARALPRPAGVSDQPTSLRGLLTTMADLLSKNTPEDEFTDGERLTLARDLTGGEEPTHNRLLAVAPRIEQSVTRGEYALLLRRVAPVAELRAEAAADYNHYASRRQGGHK